MTSTVRKGIRRLRAHLPLWYAIACVMFIETVPVMLAQETSEPAAEVSFELDLDKKSFLVWEDIEMRITLQNRGD